MKQSIDACVVCAWTIGQGDNWVQLPRTLPAVTGALGRLSVVLSEAQALLVSLQDLAAVRAVGLQLGRELLQPAEVLRGGVLLGVDRAHHRLELAVLPPQHVTSTSSLTRSRAGRSARNSIVRRAAGKLPGKLPGSSQSS